MPLRKVWVMKIDPRHLIKRAALSLPYVGKLRGHLIDINRRLAALEERGRMEERQLASSALPAGRDTVSMGALEAELRSLKGDVPDTDEYGRLSGITVNHPFVAELSRLDPFSAEYRATAMKLYLDLRGRPRDDYNPEIDERTGSDLPSDIWRNASPWFFRSTQMASEFLICWGQMMRLLDLPTNSTASILEYGSGSGQLLLFLARMGLDAHAVDIDQPSLDLVAAQSAAMGLDVKCERALFGFGFESKKFDRIIFFEAFHHAWDFGNLLDRLRERLSPGGRLILCGEPIVGQPTSGIPFAWGPRLDGLSIFCMRRFGWMELGFTESFVIEAFHRSDWLLSAHYFPDFGRATAYVATPALGTKIMMGQPLLLGRHLDGWHSPEGTYRWTRGGVAKFPVPSRGGPVDIRINFSNMLRVPKNVVFRSGGITREINVKPGFSDSIVLRGAQATTLGIECEGHRPIDITSGSQDDRNLGIAVAEIEFSAAG
jgi:SAM-dependent methyltransferase